MNTTGKTPESHGENVLQWAMALGIVGVLVGTQLATLVDDGDNFYLGFLNIVITVLTLPAVIAAAGWFKHFWETSLAQALLVASVFIMRTLFGFLFPLMFRDISRKLP